MIRRLTLRKSKEHEQVSAPKSFDDYELRLGDMMRGERATMGKSLLDVQRELRIKASYIAAIENADPSVIDTPGFIAGYVRSSARYLNMDPEIAFDTFCRESGFAVAHGMSSEASSRKEVVVPVTTSGGLGSGAFTAPTTPFAPAASGFFAQIEPRAIGSMMVLVGLIAGIGYGGLSVLREVQQVQFAPVEQTPLVLADVDPLQGARSGAGSLSSSAITHETDIAAAALDRLYRPQALDVPVLVARDAPIASLNPGSLGNFAVPELPSLTLAEASLPSTEPSGLAVPQVVETVSPGVEMVAVRPSWVQVTSADGSVIFEAIMNAGDSFSVPLTEEAPKLRTGESGAIYFAVNGSHFGPVGDRGQVSKNVDLSVDGVLDRFEVADLTDGKNSALATMVAALQTQPESE